MRRERKPVIRYFFLYLALINLIGFTMFGVDKRRAVYNGEIEKAKRRRKPEPYRTPKRRIPEKTLFVTAAIGGNVAVSPQDAAPVFCIWSSGHFAPAAADCLGGGKRTLIV